MYKVTSYSNTAQIGGGRFGNIDNLKALCAFLVVCIHAPFQGSGGEYITALARVAVPIFFMITGFFYKPERTKKQIIKIAKLIIIASGVYLLWRLAIAIVQGNLVAYLSSTFTLTNAVKFVLLNDNRLSSHLWYLNAILYVTIIAAFLYKVTPQKWKAILYVVTPLLLCGDLVFGKYSLAIWGREFPYILVRNWLFVGIPYFTIGMWIRENETDIIEKCREKNGKFICCACVVLFGITTVLERWLLASNGLNATRDHYISTTFFSIALFIFSIVLVSKKENRISRIGRDNSTWIYIFHPMMIKVFDIVVSKIGFLQDIYNTIRPVVVFVATTIAVVCVSRIIRMKPVSKRQ